jgi:plasmid replication initiation protein
MDDEWPEIIISTQELCRYLVAAEHTFELPNALIKHTIAPKVKKRKRSATPPEKISSSDEVMFAEQEERAAKRAERCDIDYEERSSTKSLSD